ncbi:DNA ligase [Sporomusaceae bacterium FL31]|nr:DNA ligase [Sporomusaceae bacterium FL31]GCE35718.1 DNA ligase [Sporomusaceae bacterium]
MINLLELSGRPKNKLVQLALDLAKVKQDKLQWPMMIAEKIDGVYCVAHKTNKVTIYSRTGEVYTSMQHIESLLYDLLDNNELIIFEACGPMGTPQSTVSGWARDTKEQHPELMAGCHDILQLSEFINGGRTPYKERYEDLKARLEFYRRGCTKGTYWSVFLIKHNWVKSLDRAKGFAEDIISGGGEGAVLKNPEGLYAPGKRNQDIIKIKQGVSFDLEVLYVQEGKGKYTNTVGTLVCKWKDGRTIDISGMTDEQRHKWWNGTEIIVGKIVQVDAMCLSSKGLLREPRFKGIRYDKSKGDF